MGNRIARSEKGLKTAALLETVETILLDLYKRLIPGRSGRRIQRSRTLSSKFLGPRTASASSACSLLTETVFDPTKVALTWHATKAGRTRGKLRDTLDGADNLSLFAHSQRS